MYFGPYVIPKKLEKYNFQVFFAILIYKVVRTFSFVGNMGADFLILGILLTAKRQKPAAN